MSANENIRDSVIRHSIFLEKYGDGLAERVVSLLNDVDKDIVKKIASGLITDYSENRLKTLLSELRAINDEVYSNVFDVLKTDLTKQGQATAEYEAKAISEALPAYQATLPTPQKLAVLATTTLIKDSPDSVGYYLKPWTDAMSKNKQERIAKALREGITQGETINDLVDRIRGSKSKGIKGVLPVSIRSARTIAITANAAIASKAREETHRANSDVIKAVMWVSTLDARTSSVCQSLDGKTWTLDEEHPTTPSHARCRSILTPITKSYDELGIAKKEISNTTRASMDGQVPSSTTYGDWLKKQPEARQNDILGKERADIFRTGKLPFDELYRKDGSFRTVDELRKKLDLPDVTNIPDAPEPKAKVEPKAIAKVKAEDIKVVSRAKAAKSLEETLKPASQDARYSQTPEFRSIKTGDFGRANLGATLTPEAASMIAEMHGELNDITDRFNVPRIRGYKTMAGGRAKSATASMGDGIMTVNAMSFNAFAREIGDKAISPDALREKSLALQNELQDISKRLSQARDARGKLATLEERASATVEINAIIREYNDKLDKVNKATRDYNSARYMEKPASTWKLGDDPKEKPFASTEYFTGIDRARSVLYHETGHVIHQQYQKTVARRVATPPIEIELRDIFRKVNRNGLLSQYAKTNEKEWFAENFAAYFMDRKDLCDPLAVELIERLLNENAK